MLKLTKKADYGLIALRHLAGTGGSGFSRRVSSSAKDIADAYRIPLPLLSKVLQKLVRTGMLMSEQGVHGGDRLAGPASGITPPEGIRALDRPVIFTPSFLKHPAPPGCHPTSYLPLPVPPPQRH